MGSPGAAHRKAAVDQHGFDRPGEGARRRAALASLTGEWLGTVWTEATDGLRPENAALAAVGSLGRGELGPASDLDLVLLHDGRPLDGRAVAELADRLWYPIWDAGARLDHSVRTVAQCRAVARTDLPATIGLLDLSAVAGEPELVAAARSAVAHDWRAAARQRLPELVGAVVARHARHGDLAQSLEPDLKEARGGLRDLTVLAALAEAWLAERPKEPVQRAGALLLDVRDAVHVVTGRGRHRLVREDHDGVAALLGYADGDELLTAVSLAARTVARALDEGLRRAGQAQRARALRVRPRRPEMTPLGHGLFASDGEVVLGPGHRAGDPALPLRAAVVAARSGLPIAPRTLDHLTTCPTPPTPWPAEARDLLGDLLAAGPGLLPVWESLDQVGIIGRWLPEWDAVRARPQRSPVHRHTVDRHLLECVVQAVGHSRDVSRPDLLLLAALLHDIGKVGGSRDHGAEGAVTAEEVAHRLGHTPEDAGLVALLVREHLTLIDLATRRDHEDPATLEAAVAAVSGSPQVLALLRALTEADAVAAGPAAWTEWRATLVDRFTGKVRQRLVPDPVASGPEDGTGRIHDDDLEEVHRGSVVVRRTSQGTTWRLDVIAADRLGLFADTAGVLAAHGLVVRSAVVRTIDGVAVDEWHVEAPGGDPPDTERLARALRRLAAGDRAPLDRLDAATDRSTRASRSTRPALSSAAAGLGSPGEARAVVVPGGSPAATVIEVRAQDRVGVLHDLGRALAGAGVAVRSAHVETHAGQTLDTFYVTDRAGRPLTPAEVARTVALVIDACEHPPGGPP